jgi:flagellar basal-body rod protein FlgG
VYKGIYIAASGALMKQKQMEVISNNLANADTTGFKKDGVTFKKYLMSEHNGIEQAGDGRAMTYYDETFTDHSHGGIIQTGNPLDVALDGNGFFALEGDKYTRRGDFKLDAEGFLSTKNGEKVLGVGGPIQIIGNDVSIGSKGEIKVDGQIINAIRVVDFQSYKELVKTGDSIYTTAQEATPARVNVAQGFKEMSNVNVVKEMTEMINTFREYESYQKLIQSFDEATGKVTNEMARV